MASELLMRVARAVRDACAAKWHGPRCFMDDDDLAAIVAPFEREAGERERAERERALRDAMRVAEQHDETCHPQRRDGCGWHIAMEISDLLPPTAASEPAPEPAGERDALAEVGQCHHGRAVEVSGGRGVELCTHDSGHKGPCSFEREPTAASEPAPAAPQATAEELTALSEYERKRVAEFRMLLDGGERLPDMVPTEDRKGLRAPVELLLTLVERTSRELDEVLQECRTRGRELERAQEALAQLDLHDAHVDAAVAAERERVYEECARIADEHGEFHVGGLIRARAAQAGKG